MPPSETWIGPDKLRRNDCNRRAQCIRRRIHHATQPWRSRGTEGVVEGRDRWGARRQGSRDGAGAAGEMRAAAEPLLPLETEYQVGAYSIFEDRSDAACRCARTLNAGRNPFLIPSPAA